MNDKPWYVSRTILANAVGGAAAVAAVFGLDMTPEVQAQIATLIMVLTNIVNIALRLITKTPIRSSDRSTLSSHWVVIPILAVVMIGLSSCDSLRPATVSADKSEPQQLLFAMQSDYNVLLTAAVAYEEQPRCPEEVQDVVASLRAGCSLTSVVDALRLADARAEPVLRMAQQVARFEDATVSELERWVSRVEIVLSGLREVVNTLEN